MRTKVKIDNCKLFALANDKDLLDRVSMILFEKCFQFQADLMVFTSDAKNAQYWYGIKCEKRIDETVDEEEFYAPWLAVLEECGKTLGNNGIVFCQFMEYSWGEKRAVARYSSPKGVGEQDSHCQRKAWANGFDAANKTAIYNIGKLLIPDELYNTKEPSGMAYYPNGADSSYDLVLERKREALAHARRLKTEKEPAVDENPAESDKKKGYYRVDIASPEQVPFHAVITHAWPCDEDMFNPYDSEITATLAGRVQEAAEMLTDEENRTLLASMLIAEDLRLNPRCIADFDAPVFVVQNGKRASVAYKGRKGYSVLLCELNPPAAYCGYPENTEPQAVKQELEANSDRIWEVDHNLLMEKMKEFENK